MVSTWEYWRALEITWEFWGVLKSTWEYWGLLESRKMTPIKYFHHNLFLASNQKLILRKFLHFINWIRISLNTWYLCSFYKMFSIWSIKLQNAIKNINLVLIWSQINSFQNNLFWPSIKKLILQNCLYS